MLAINLPLTRANANRRILGFWEGRVSDLEDLSPGGVALRRRYCRQRLRGLFAKIDPLGGLCSDSACRRRPRSPTLTIIGIRAALAHAGARRARLFDHDARRRAASGAFAGNLVPNAGSHLAEDESVRVVGLGYRDRRAAVGGLADL